MTAQTRFNLLLFASLFGSVAAAVMSSFPAFLGNWMFSGKILFLGVIFGLIAAFPLAFLVAWVRSSFRGYVVTGDVLAVGVVVYSCIRQIALGM